MTTLYVRDLSQPAFEFHYNHGISSFDKSFTAADGSHFISEPGSYPYRVYGTSATSVVGRPISNTLDDTLYWHAVYGEQQFGANPGPLEYAYPVGLVDTFDVSIYMAETYFSNDNQRVFDLILEGDTVLKNLDIHAEVGKDAALVKTFKIYVDDGTLNLIASATTDNAQIAGISIISRSLYPCPLNCTDFLDTTAVAICDGDSVLAGGAWRTTTGLYCDTILKADGCDSVVCTNLSLKPVVSVSVADSICSTDSIFVGGGWQTTAGVYYDTLTGSNGCDSIVATSLYIRLASDPVCAPPCVTSIDTITMVVCTGDSIFIGGAYRDTAGIFCDSLTSTAGCDSIVCYNLSIGQSLEITALNLVNAPSGSLITELTSGYTIVKSAIGNFSVEAIPCGSLVKSVVFELNGSVFQTENVVPYAINGDNAGAFKNWNPVAGVYIIRAIPYSGKNATGVAGIAKAVTVTVIQSGGITDCNGVMGGSAYYNDCNICVGGNTGKPANFGKDDCGVCNGNNLNKDCAGVCFGTAVLDSCDECVLGTTGKAFNNSCNVDCNGVIGGSAMVDSCGVCAGGNTGVTPNSAKDTCGVCFGNNLSCAPCNPLEVTELMLVDADNNSDIAPLTNGYTINKALIGIFSVRADVCNYDSVGSVRFFLNGALEKNENIAPYLINGDKGGIYKKWNPAPGTYTLMAVPYSSNNGTGTAGISLSLVINIIDNVPLVDCNGDVGGSAYLNDCDSCVGGNTGHSLDYGKDDCGVCNGNNANKDCAGVCFGTAVIDSCGDCVLGNTGQAFNGNCNVDCNGNVNGSAIIDSCGVCAGGNTGIIPNASIDTCGVCFGNNLSCAGCAGNEVTELILYDASTDLLIRDLNSIDTINRTQLSAFNVVAQVCSDNLVSSVRFALNGSVERTENIAPYAIGGDVGGNFNSWNVPNGVYTLVATPYSGNNASGSMGVSKTITLTILGGTGARTTGDQNGQLPGNNQTGKQEQVLGRTELLTSSPEVKIYPNPSEGIFHLEILGCTGEVDLIIVDASGRLVNSFKATAEDGRIQESIDLTKLPRGVYLMRIKMGEAIRTERLIIR